jgi:hypothetical protein
MQRCSATEQGSNAGFEKCVLYGERRHAYHAGLLIKAVHSFTLHAIGECTAVVWLGLPVTHCDHATDATHPGVQARALGQRESNLKCRRASTCSPVANCHLHANYGIITDCSLHAGTSNFRTPSPRSPLTALSVQRAADVPLKCLELSCLCRYDCPDPCYVLISDRTMCEGSAWQGGKCRTLRPNNFMTTHFDQHCEVMLTMPAPTPPDSTNKHGCARAGGCLCLHSHAEW